MSRFTISQVARQMRLRPSAIRYYEKLGLLPHPERVSGRRRYDAVALCRLAVIQQARQAGFRLHEIRTLFFGFRPTIPAGARWRRLADLKLAELHNLARQIRSMQRLLQRMQSKCRCQTLEICGRSILAKGIHGAIRPPLPLAPPLRPSQGIRGRSSQ